MVLFRRALRVRRRRSRKEGKRHHHDRLSLETPSGEAEKASKKPWLKNSERPYQTPSRRIAREIRPMNSSTRPLAVFVNVLGRKRSS